MTSSLSAGILATFLSISIAILAVYYCGIAVSPRQGFYDDRDLSVEPEILNLFMSYDENLDGKIDPKEFIQIANRIFGKKGSSVLGDPLVQENWDQSGEKITVNASFQPLMLSTMTKFSGTSFAGYDDPIEMLKSWRQVSKPVTTFPVSAFSIFLPSKHLQLGEPWYIITPQTTKYGPTLSSNRYVPPPVRENGVLIHRLLSMFHSRVFVMSRFGPQGTAACIQAHNDKYLSIAFRIHAEFQLNEPPLLPFWFSPAQFAGNIVISRDGKHIKSFNMAVPNNRSLNVDMEWLLNIEEEKDYETGDNTNAEERYQGGKSVRMEVDIGYVPQMDINSNGPSCIRNNSSDIGTECSSEVLTVDKDIVWESEMTQKKVEGILTAFFYPFKQVSYVPFKEAFKQAKAQSKPVHHILLWGALDDQSC